MEEPRWVPRLVVEVIHTDQVREHGGLLGIRDGGLLEAALARPRQMWAYGDDVDLPLLAASYAHGILSNHPFLDGNKRTALLALAVFLGLNGLDFEAEEEDVVSTIRSAAAGEVDLEDLAQWIRERVKQVE